MHVLWPMTCLAVLGLAACVPPPPAAQLESARQSALRTQYEYAQRIQADQAASQREAEQKQEEQRQAAAVQAKAVEDRAAAIEAAENSPDNACREPDTARTMISEFNRFPMSERLSISAVDMRHVSTIQQAAVGQGLICHATMVLNDGRSLTGTMSFTHNIAGDPLVNWKSD